MNTSHYKFMIRTGKYLPEENVINTGNDCYLYNKIDENNNLIYMESSSGFWAVRQFDSNNNEIYYKDSSGAWIERKYDTKGNELSYKEHDGAWGRREYDCNNKVIYHENSTRGLILDER